MLGRLEAQERRRRPSDADLLDRAQRLSSEYLAGRAVPTSVRWVSNQSSRWGSCTPTDGTIRLSSRLRTRPLWVVDYVLLHELVHLVERTHSARFWSLVGTYPRAERARGYLEGLAAAGSAGPTSGDPQRAGEGRDVGGLGGFAGLDEADGSDGVDSGVDESDSGTETEPTVETDTAAIV
jgi:hypothetical protein